MRQTRSAWLAGILTLLTLSLYGWLSLGKAREEISKLETAGMAADVKRWPLRLCLFLMLLLVPADIVLRIVFVTKPGFLQPEVLASVGVIWLASSFFAGRLQAKINGLPAAPATAASPEVPAPLSQQPLQTYANPQAAVTPQPVSAPTPLTGSSWQQGIATIAPTVAAPDTNQPASPVQPAAAPQVTLQAQQPQVVAPTIVQPKQ